MTTDPTPTLSDADRETLLPWATAMAAASGVHASQMSVALSSSEARLSRIVAALIARERKSARDQALDEAAEALLLMAADRMDEHGPHDARGAAIWDCGVFLREQFNQST